jgi:hypothetical protein
MRRPRLILLAVLALAVTACGSLSAPSPAASPQPTPYAPGTASAPRRSASASPPAAASSVPAPALSPAPASSPTPAGQVPDLIEEMVSRTLEDGGRVLVVHDALGRIAARVPSSAQRSRRGT